MNYKVKLENEVWACIIPVFLHYLAESFEPHYGVGGREGDGDVFKEENIKAFTKFVLENTEGKGNNQNIDLLLDVQNDVNFSVLFMSFKACKKF